ncbi:MAG: hypothetical protein CVV27_21825 [Candidatus Melainabacteria bacterium HGW-Melainabacteria-1]|nr:MAG: hypothetical protein CVV27_21825 [Candidatus Melainabacteria bacterium HGW-Melainabacteria-1]
MHNDYELLDSGDGRKLERFGRVILSRPCVQAVWDQTTPEVWASATASFDRDSGWQANIGSALPSGWIATINTIVMRLELTPAGHVGVFPETRELWDWITDTLSTRQPAHINVLNLFAYSGGATIAAARAGCSVCHVDSSRSMVTRARENAGLNNLDAAPIRWIVEDVLKFLDREIRRGQRYDAIMLDPPSFGRGTRGEQYKIDRDLVPTLERCKALLSTEPAFLLLTAHSKGTTASDLEDSLSHVLERGDIAAGEMRLTGGKEVRPVADGVWARWTGPR